MHILPRAGALWDKNDADVGHSTGRVTSYAKVRVSADSKTWLWLWGGTGARHGVKLSKSERDKTARQAPLGQLILRLPSIPDCDVSSMYVLRHIGVVIASFQAI